MRLQSMTGFARAEGSSGRNRFVWELRSVNGKGLDIRLRLPPGMERLEPDIRQLIGECVSRGNLQVSLNVTVTEAVVEAVLNRDALAAILALREELGDLVDRAPLKLDTLLGIRGLVDIREAQEGEDAVAARDAAILGSLKQAVARLEEMRLSEGSALLTVLKGQVDRIAQLTDVVEADPSRTPEEIGRRLAVQLDALLQDNGTLDRDRLHAEAALLATRSDLREEIDRLKAHVAAARELLDKGGPVGRRLDFLAQEFNRESNTICSKSNSAAVTAAGIELKVVIDQFREQVQNLE
ncbi:YicC family protein [Neorhizobium lilium]|uniref:YicC family protein n=1 Tax=Neorhizobium lilium TaxID=2503024 RepID=A0A444LDJ6_9HYPH|nr:YicC/YloC family endoribonuclease [Neorhizobium lilium]RWX75878.1 YicC family protein [Neorhizobium lilium]